MKTAILTIVLFCIMIFPHELGHFLAAKKMGVQVNEFAFGMGPTNLEETAGRNAAQHSSVSDRRLLRHGGRGRRFG